MQKQTKTLVTDTKSLISKLSKVEELSMVKDIAALLTHNLVAIEEQLEKCSQKPVKAESDNGIVPNVFSLAELIDGLHRAHLPRALEKGLDFQFNLGPSLPQKLIGNGESLKKILDLLLEYSMEQIDQGRLMLTCLYQEDQVILSVSDSDCGTSSSQNQQKQFLKTFKNRLQTLDGFLSVRREERLGTIYHIKIPFQETSETAQHLSEGEEMVLNWLKENKENQELIQVFYKSLRLLRIEMVNLQKVVRTKNREKMASLIHGMKGFPGGFGLNAVYQRLLKIEKKIELYPCDFKGIWAEIENMNDLLTSIPECYFQLETEKLVVQVVQTNPSVEKGKNKKILVAEDNQMNQEIVQYVLSKIDYDYCFVENGEEVLEALNLQTFDLLLLDMQMPKMDGFETLKIIRANRRFDDLPIIAVTANALAKDENTYVSAGCNDYIPKPIIFDEMICKIKNLCGNSC